MSKRTQIRQKRQRQSQLQTFFLIVLAVAALGAVGYLIFQGTQSGPLASATVDPGKTQGSANAKVVVQEFSDFQ